MQASIMATAIRWIITLLAVINFGYMAFDGSGALIKGDYIRPPSGAYAGQLGPWSKLVRAAGIDPGSRAMKLVFLILGISGLFIGISFMFRAGWAVNALFLINVLSIWYIVPGTIVSILQIVLLFIFRSIA